ncbi:hypothetical protein [Streptacidiphilus sp. EB103A]|uniref:hypothetical protein n=1 Tax=Streptacidiphilus sp. EB103A TaxID=3156275 RepID=UPI0035199C46
MVKNLVDAVLVLAGAVGFGFVGAAFVFGFVKGLRFLCRWRGWGIGLRLCVPCARVMPSALHRHGRWTCLACTTPHPDPSRR